MDFQGYISEEQAPEESETQQPEPVQKQPKVKKSVSLKNVAITGKKAVGHALSGLAGITKSLIAVSKNEGTPILDGIASASSEGLERLKQGKPLLPVKDSLNKMSDNLTQHFKEHPVIKKHLEGNPYTKMSNDVVQQKLDRAEKAKEYINQKVREYSSDPKMKEHLAKHQNRAKLHDERINMMKKAIEFNNSIGSGVDKNESVAIRNFSSYITEAEEEQAVAQKKEKVMQFIQALQQKKQQGGLTPHEEEVLKQLEDTAEQLGMQIQRLDTVAQDQPEQGAQPVSGSEQDVDPNQDPEGGNEEPQSEAVAPDPNDPNAQAQEQQQYDMITGLPIEPTSGMPMNPMTGSLDQHSIQLHDITTMPLNQKLSMMTDLIKEYGYPNVSYKIDNDRSSLEIFGKLEDRDKQAIEDVSMDMNLKVTIEEQPVDDKKTITKIRINNLMDAKSFYDVWLKLKKDREQKAMEKLGMLPGMM